MPDLTAMAHNSSELIRLANRVAAGAFGPAECAWLADAFRRHRAIGRDLPGCLGLSSTHSLGSAYAMRRAAQRELLIAAACAMDPKLSNWRQIERLHAAITDLRARGHRGVNTASRAWIFEALQLGALPRTSHGLSDLVLAPLATHRARCESQAIVSADPPSDN